MEVDPATVTAARISANTASPSVFIGTFGVVFALIAFFLVFDTFVARIDTDEAQSRALSAYKEGTRLFHSGKFDAAAEQFSAAAAMDRENITYRVALARVTLRQGDMETAQTLLRSILQKDPTDGSANVLMARALVEQGHVEDGIAYYHSAVYGRWRPGETGSSLQARFELINLLAATNAKQALLAELLPIQDQSLEDLTLRDSLGYLFLKAGSPARAADVFHQVLQKDEKDVRAYSGLGEASLALGNYAAAEGQFARAVRLSPNDTVIATRRDLARNLAEMNPSERGLRLSDRYQRARGMLLLTVQTVARCPLDSAASAAAAAAVSALGKSPGSSGDALDDFARENIGIAQRLWNLRPVACVAETTPREKALAVLQNALSR
ncbi:MAG: tetratricopeptide repeat protein [Gemmatimonadaceae bacterium]